MKIFITGISGLIGRHLAKTFRQSGHTVSGLTRNTERASKVLPASVSLVDRLDDAQDYMPDVVINLAGAPIADKRWSDSRKRELKSSRIKLTDELVDWMRQMKQHPDVFISGSAVGYYGRQGDKDITETSEPHPEFTHELCQEWEQAALKADDICRVCLLRTGLVVAPKGGFLDKMKLPFALGLGGRIGSGQQYMSWIHLDDMVSGIEHLIQDSTLSGAFNMTAPNPVTNQHFSQALASSLNRPAIFPAPGFALKLLLGEMSDLLLTGQKVLPQRLTQSGFQFQFPNVEPALVQVMDK
ncbi:TIGR01777 family oxidoreductase [Pleionea mediterranea]|uniref:TIGR01777 family protein n=1 Tax=Pleionea mediterranea TaxID=523701 RepID=A0A316FHR1_9GAMM|nr:TIGR01777 family oxidoreductase [Pleionea mediterranea]PWK48461.1 hypothetical protein C8D97_10910 [Pleionea mediterranea]